MCEVDGCVKYKMDVWSRRWMYGVEDERVEKYGQC